MSAPAATAAPKSSSVLEDIVDVFYVPSAVFERRRNAGFGLALLLYVLISAAMFYAARPAMRPMFEKQIAQQIEKVQANPNLSAEQKESMSARMRSMVDSPFTMIGPVVAFPVIILLTALVLWLSGKLFGSAATYGQAAMVATFASFPRLLLSALMIGYFVATGREVSSQFAMTFSPALLLGDDASPVLGAVLSRLDLGVLWYTALLGIGIAVVGRISRASGMGAAATTWLVGGIAVVLSALRSMA